MSSLTHGLAETNAVETNAVETNAVETNAVEFHEVGDHSYVTLFTFNASRALRQILFQ